MEKRGKQFKGEYNSKKDINIFWTDCELIPELTSSQCDWKGNRKGKGTEETPPRMVVGKGHQRHESVSCEHLQPELGGHLVL